MFSVEAMVRGYNEYSVEAMVRGYNEYQNTFDTPIGEILSCEREVGNIHDTCT